MRRTGTDDVALERAQQRAVDPVGGRQRIERILQDIQAERAEAAATHDTPGDDEPHSDDQ